MTVWAVIGITALSFAAMEGVAWAMHRYVMHGFLWVLHKDHHGHGHGGPFERNDLFFPIFATPSVLLFVLGHLQGPGAPWTWMALGVLLYGIAYFLVHEVFIHQRIKWLRNSRNIYFLALRRAHKAHHARTGKADGQCFGMLLVPMKYFRQARTLRQPKAGRA